MKEKRTHAENKYCTEKIIICKKDDKSSHQDTIKFHIFISSKGVGVYFDI